MKKEFVIFDTEYTTWEGAQDRHWSGAKEYREIVQIGALKVDSETFEEIETLDILIKPTINPVLSDFFTDLTGITQDDVDQKGVSFEDGITTFGRFCHELKACSYSNDSMIIAENIALLKRFDLGLPHIYFYNFAELFHRADPETKNYSSGQLVKYLGIDLPEKECVHNALYDCRSLLAALKHYQNQGKTQVNL